MELPSSSEGFEEILTIRTFQESPRASEGGFAGCLIGRETRSPGEKAKIGYLTHVTSVFGLFVGKAQVLKELLEHLQIIVSGVIFNSGYASCNYFSQTLKSQYRIGISRY